MKKNCFVLTLECLGLQLVFSIVSMGLYTDFFPDILYSIFTAWLFIWSIHSTFWQLGNKEMKRIKIYNNNLLPGQNPVKQNIFKGALLAIPFFALNFLLLVFTCIFNENILVTIQAISQFHFIGFLTPADDALGINYFLPRFAVCLVMYLACAGAYISGAKNYSFFDKYFHRIIYKTKNEEEKDK